MSELQPFWDAERSAPSVSVTDSDIREWERRYGVALPPSLAAMLVVQNGGGVSETEFFIEPLAKISPLSDEQLDQVSEGDDLDFSDGGKRFVFGYDEVGATLALDYSVGPEPRVVSLWFDGSGESQVEADSFDEFVGIGGVDPADID